MAGGWRAHIGKPQTVQALIRRSQPREHSLQADCQSAAGFQPAPQTNSSTRPMLPLAEAFKPAVNVSPPA